MSNDELLYRSLPVLSSEKRQLRQELEELLLTKEIGQDQMILIEHGK